MEWNDSHDKRVEKILERFQDPERMQRYLADDERHLEPLITNFNLVGIRRRLNSIQLAVWAIALMLGIYLYRHW